MRCSISVEEIIGYDFERINTMDTGIYNIEFHDGVIPMLSREIRLNWFFLKMFEPFLASVRPSMNDVWVAERKNSDGSITRSDFNDAVTITLGEKIIFKIFAAIEDGEEDQDKLFNLAREFYENTSHVYNDSVNYLHQWNTTGDLTHYIAFEKHQSIQNAMSEYDTDLSMDERKVYDAVSNLASHIEPGMEINEIRRGVACGILNSRSIHQSFAPRGFTKELNGRTFLWPVQTSYLEGMNTLYDAATEKISASRASYAQGTQLENSEFFSRRIRIATSVIQKIVGKDCGSPHLIDWEVTEHSLKILDGSTQVLEDGSYHHITKADKHLIGTNIKLRNPTTCINDDPQTVCKTCMGRAAVTINPKGNLGIAMIVYLMSLTSQKILSVKHLEQSILPLILAIQEENKQYINYQRGNKWNVVLRKPRKGRVILKLADTGNWTTVLKEVENLDNIEPSRLANIQSVVIEQLDRHGNVANSIHQSMRPIETLFVGSYFSKAFLQYIKEKGWTTDDGTVSIDITEWTENNRSTPAMHAPRINADTREFLSRLISFLFGSAKFTEEVEEANIKPNNGPIEAIGNCTTPKQALMTLCDLFSPPPGSIFDKSATIDCNILEVSIIVKAAMCRDPDNFDYSIPKGGEPFSFVNLGNCIPNRSIGGALAYQGHGRLLTTARPMLIKNRIASSMDNFLM